MRRWFTVTSLATFLLAGLAARADGPSLEQIQAEVRRGFERTVTSQQEDLEDACGKRVGVTVDWENFRVETWAVKRETRDGEPKPPERIARDQVNTATARLGASCTTPLEAIENLCRSSWKPVVAREVKEVRCLLSGHSLRRADEPANTHVRRNVSFEGGVLTFHAAPGLAGVEENVRAVLARALQKLPDSPEKDGLGNGETGESCTRAKDCWSQLCIAKVCTPCGKAACGAGLTCMKGRCRDEDERELLSHGNGKTADIACLSSGADTPSPFHCCSKKMSSHTVRGHRRQVCE